MNCKNCGSNELVEMNDLYNPEKDLTDGQESEALAKEFNGEVEFECLNCNHTQFEKIYNTDIEEDDLITELKKQEKELNKKEPPKIYLIGKVKGTKWDIIKDIKNAKFISSDGSNHSEHLWGYGYGEFGDLNEDVKTRVTNEIKNCDFLIAYLDKSDCYGSIAEIAYASGLGKKVFLFIDKEEREKEIERNTIKNKEGEIIGIEPLNCFYYDAYWLVSCFPGVETLECNKEEIKEIIKIICDRNQKKISQDFISGFSSKIIKEELDQKREEFIKILTSQEKEDFEELSKREPMSKIIKYFKRNQKIVKKLKEIYNNQCQICEFTFKKDNGENYSETHHLIPLQNNGVDNIKNLVVVCPNCHKKLHYAKKEKYDIKYKEEHYKILEVEK